MLAVAVSREAVRNGALTMLVSCLMLYERAMYPPTSMTAPMGRQSKRQSLYRMHVCQSRTAAGMKYRTAKRTAAAREGL